MLPDMGKCKTVVAVLSGGGHQVFGVSLHMQQLHIGGVSGALVSIASLGITVVTGDVHVHGPIRAGNGDLGKSEPGGFSSSCGQLTTGLGLATFADHSFLPCN